MILESGIIETKLFDATYGNEDTGRSVVSLFKEMGSPRAFLIEFLLADAWKETYYRQKQTKGVDLIPHDVTKRSLEVKATNASGGVDLQPSGGKGMNRTPKIDVFYTNCATSDYVVVDSQYLKDTGDIRYVILSGEFLLQNQKHKFTKKEVAKIFI